MKIYFYLSILFILIVSCEGDSSLSTNPGKTGSMARFAISGDYLYTVTESDLTAYNITTPSSPVKLSSQHVQGFAETIFAKDSLLFFGTRNGMLIYDNSNPAEPSFVSSYSHIYSCDPVIVHQNTAYVTLNSGSFNCGRSNNRLDIIDISNPYSPRIIDQHNMVSPKGLGMFKDVLFLCDDGLKAFEVDEYKNLNLVAHYNDVDAYDVITDQGYIFLIGQDGFHQYKYTNNTVLKVSSILTEKK